MNIISKIKQFILVAKSNDIEKYNESNGRVIKGVIVSERLIR